MTKETVDYYDKESGGYSEKRYPQITSSYTQFVFKKRLGLFMSFLKQVNKRLPENSTVLEIGCADGIVFKAIESKFPRFFSKLVGADISPEMIKEANEKNIIKEASFFLRDNVPNELYDVVIELGVHPFDLKSELNYVSQHLRTGGYFFYSTVGRGSIFTRIKLMDKEYVADYKTYQGYEETFRGSFEIVDSSVYGLFVPKLWSIPILGRLLQPIFDFIFKYIRPEFFHEKLYVLEKL